VSRRARITLKALVWAACLTPLALLLFRALVGDLGANPIETLTRTLGVWTLRLLLASLAMTPLRLTFGVAWPVTLRRLLGLFAFFYACLHFSVWIVLDHFFAWEEMLADVLKRPYITVGVLALTLLVPLATTSTARMVKRLGAANWKRLHRLVYVVGILGVLHFLWLAKVGRNDPYLYLGILTLLLGVRLWIWLRRLAREGTRRVPWRRFEPSDQPAVPTRQSSPAAAPSRDPSRV
jgi:sulfoxide reductase heme-binding subunit YedZ